MRWWTIILLGALGGACDDGRQTTPPPPCSNECETVGASACADGSVRACVMDVNGCLGWGDPTSCALGRCADATTCEGCTDSCPVEGASVCEGSERKTCNREGGGCLAWSAPHTCSSGFCADATSCGMCNHGCAIDGTQKCDRGLVSTCTANANGCRRWQLSSSCPDGFCADATSCGMCNHGCDIDGRTECNNGALRRCAADANGCRAWSAAMPCAEGFCGDATSCGSCNHGCTTPGDTDCAQGQIETCEADTNGCRTWSTPTACAEGFCADRTSCGMCNHACSTAGDTSCQQGELATCVADTNGCLDWATAVPCDDGFCADTMTCGVCNHGCAMAGDTECDTGQLRTCIADTNGCRSFGAPMACTDGFCADAMTCGVCNHGCDTAGEVSCTNGETRTCVADADGCRDWTAATPCAEGFCGSATACGMCTNGCTNAGEARCQAGEASTCTADANGCLDWSAPTVCANGCRDATQCEPCAHECPTWGMTCNGDTAESCVVDNLGCRKLLTASCGLGCSGGQCDSCTSISEPSRGAALNDESGWYKEIVVAGSTAIVSWNERNGQYSGQDWGITAFDLTNPASPVAGTPLTLRTGTYVRNLELVGNRLFFLDGDGVQIYDVTNPNAPTSIATYPATDQPTIKRSLSVDGDRACLGTDAGLQIIDVTPQQTPALVGTYAASSRVHQVVCRGRYAFLVLPNKLEVVDLINPALPVSVVDATVTNIDVWNDNLRWDGTYLYVARSYSYNSGFWSALDAWRFTPPMTLVRAGTLQELTSVRSSHLDGDDLYVAMSDSVGVIDVSNPGAPAWKARVEVTSGSAGVYQYGDATLLAGDGLKSFDLGDGVPYRERPIGNDYLLAGQRFGALSVLARRTSGLVVQHMADPTAPTILSTEPMDATDVVVRGRHAFVTAEAGSGELRIYDIGNPWQPLMIGQVSAGAHSGYIWNLHLEGDRAYALCGLGHVCVFDVSNVTNPTKIADSSIISQTVGSSSRWSVAAYSGDYLLLPEPDLLTVIDMSSPAAPMVAGTLTLPGNYGDIDIAVDGNQAFIVMECVGFADLCYYVIDITNPAQPSVLGSAMRDIRFHAGFYQTLNSSPTLARLRIEPPLVYLSNQWGGVLVLDVSDPSDPTPVRELWTPVPARESYMHGRFLTVHGYAGFPYPAPSRQLDQVMELCR